MSAPTITEFLLARIAENEEAARAAVIDWPADTQFWDVDVYVHVARHNPARVLAECEAKRRIVDDLAPTVDDGDGYAAAARNVLECLASVYADHPDFDPAWRLS